VPDRTAACPPFGCSPADATTEISSGSIPTDYWPRTSQVLIAGSPSSVPEYYSLLSWIDPQCCPEKYALDFQLHSFWSSVCCPILNKRIGREITTVLCAFFPSKDGSRILIWNQWARFVQVLLRSWLPTQQSFMERTLVWDSRTKIFLKILFIRIFWKKSMGYYLVVSSRKYLEKLGNSTEYHTY